MSDPIRDLENLSAEGPEMAALPAAEVRRRGDRLRRRNATLLSVAGAVAVAAIVAVPIALDGGNDKAGPDTDFATQTPSATSSAEAGSAWMATIPQGFPLDEGVPTENPDDGSPVTIERNTNGEIDQLCGEPVDLTVDRLDEENASYADSTDMRSRALSLYGSDKSAQAALDAVAATVDGCRPQVVEEGSERVTIPFEMATGDAAIGWTARTRTDGELYPDVTVWQVVRVGNALLVSILSQEIGSTPALQVRQAAVAEASPVVEAMDVFAGRPDAAPTESDASSPRPGPSTSDGIPAGFPIDADLTSPEGEPIDGPSAEAEGAPRVDLCGSTIWPAGGAARLAATATGPEFRDSRELVVYDSADTAVEVVAGVRKAVGECPGQPAEGDGVQVIEAEPGDTGYDSATFSITYGQALGGELFQFTRVGRAVLVTYTSGEWQRASAGAAAAAADVTGRTRAITPTMCTFTAAGC